MKTNMYHYYVSLLLDIVIICLIGALSAVFYFRADMTSNAVMSLRPVTRDLLMSLDDTLSITYFVSPEFESYTSGIFYVDAKLQEFASAHYLVSYKKQDPHSSGSSKNVESYGLLPRQINIARNAAEITVPVYSGIVFEYKGAIQTIPVLYDADNLEYFASSCISRLLFNRQRIAGIVMSETFEQDSRVYAHIPQWLLSCGVQPVFVHAGDDMRNLDVVIVFGDDTLSAELAADIVQYSRNGGSVLTALSPSDVQLHSDWLCNPVNYHALEPLLSDFGITYHDVLVCDTSNIRLQLQSQTESGVEYVRYPLWVNVVPSGLSQSHPVTAVLNGLTCFWPGYISFNGTDSNTVPLAYSSRHSTIMHPPFETNPYVSALSFFDSEPQQPYCLAAAALRTDALINRRFIVVADSLFASDTIQVSGSVYNLDFLSNAVDWLSGNEELLALKTKGAGIRRLDFDPADEHDVQSAFIATAICCAGIPLIVLFIMAAVLLYRRRRP